MCVSERGEGENGDTQFPHFNHQVSRIFKSILYFLKILFYWWKPERRGEMDEVNQKTLHMLLPLLYMPELSVAKKTFKIDVFFEN